MRQYRFYVSKEQIKKDYIEIDNDEHIHLSKVLRLKVGDNITVICNDGFIRDCILTEIGKKSSIAKIVTIIEDEKPKVEVCVFQALIRADKMDFVAQKCTELGVSKLIPFESSFCTVTDKGNKIDRLNRIILASCKQSGRTNIMQVNDTLQFKELLVKLKDFDIIIFANEKDQQSAKDILSKLNNYDKIAIIIGCEGGFSEEEAESIIKAGAKSISLGKLILRAETATLALVSVVMYELGEWKR